MKLIVDLVRLLTTDHDLSRVVSHDSKPFHVAYPEHQSLVNLQLTKIALLL